MQVAHKNSAGALANYRFNAKARIVLEEKKGISIIPQRMRKHPFATNSTSPLLRPRKTFTQLACFIRAVLFQTRIQQQYSTQRFNNPSPRNLSSRASSRKTKTSKSQAAAHTTLLQPPVLIPSTAYIYTPQKRDKMMPQSVQIPGLTLINNLAPHAIAPTSEGGFISAGSGPRSQVAAATTKRAMASVATMQNPPLKKKENKKAKARRLLAEAEAQAQAQTQPAVNRNGYAHPPNQYVRTSCLFPSSRSLPPCPIIE